ncbi:MAG: YcxB family protein [Lachnospiraceae bacterium]|nr:YcxB family protein [Lachnospiraceae bacterium]
MTDTKTKSIKMTFWALYSYVMNTNYRSIAGVLGLFLSLGSIGILIIGWNGLLLRQKIIFIIIALAFTVINPVMLAVKTASQLKKSPSYKKPLNYSFGDDGILVSQDELSQKIKWKDIYRIMLTKSMVAIYTGPVTAFVIPLSELGKDKGKILSAVVQFTAAYKPRLSRNLKVYQTGKGL